MPARAGVLLKAATVRPAALQPNAFKSLRRESVTARLLLTACWCAREQR
jgi:hypothetical protein